MTAREQLDAKLEKFDRDQRREQIWGKTFAVLVGVWTLLCAPFFLDLWMENSVLPTVPKGVVITLYSAGITVLVVFSWMRARRNA